MGMLKCDLCGSTEIELNADGYGVCSYCGAKYTREALKQQINNYNNINNNIQNLNAQNVYINNNSPEFEISGGRLDKYNGHSQDVILPDSVICIGPKVFQGTYIRTVRFPQGLKSIKAEAFAECNDLVNIELPVGLEEICDNAFSHSRLNNIRIPQSIRYIGKGIFYGCRINTIYFECYMDTSSVLDIVVGANINSVYMPKDIKELKYEHYYNFSETHIASLFLPPDFNVGKAKKFYKSTEYLVTTGSIYRGERYHCIDRIFVGSKEI